MCFAICLLFVLSSERFFHWFIVPVFVCGVLVGIDVVDWFRGRMNLIDPIGLVALFGMHLFFLSPLLHVLWDHQLAYLPALEEWRPWFGGLAILNASGLLVYRFSRNWIKIPEGQTRSRQRTWKINFKFLPILMYIGLGVTASLQLYVYSLYGGIDGYINIYELTFTGQRIFDGMGPLFAFSESFPFIFFVGGVVYLRNRNSKSWFWIFLLLAVFLILRFFFGGLRGSRSTILFALIWATAAIHLWIRPFPRRFLVIGVVLFVMLMYALGFYKSLGSDISLVFENLGNISQFEEQTGRDFQIVVLGDLSQISVQGYILHNITQLWPEFEYAWGRTYLGYLSPIPRSIWRSKPEFKVVEGTNALYGPGSFQTGSFVASKVYGLMGEGILNFTPYLAPLVFIQLGLAVGIVRRWLYSWAKDDSRFLLLPFALMFCMLLLASDADNTAAFLIGTGLVPFLVVFLGSILSYTEPEPETTTQQAGI
jgi:hypothetical protein